jgi:uncharacterized protein YjbI with pentapeptide repeats
MAGNDRRKQMANQEYLKQGKAAWDEWRAQHPDTRPDFSEADLIDANLRGADLSQADLNDANLRRTTIVGTNFTKAILTNCRIYGISAWDVELQEAEQNSLIITDYLQPTITVDNLEIAQFIYLLLNNTKIRDVIDTIAKKAVLILGIPTLQICLLP